MKEIITGFNLEFLFDNRFWNHVLESEREGSVDNIVKPISTFMTAYDALHNFILNEIIIDDNEDFSIISFVLPEDNELSSPKRISLLMENVTDASELLSEIYNIEEHTLSLASCDSGSDKAFTFAGKAQIIEKLKGFFLSIWEKVAFYEQEKRLKELKIVAETLPIYEKIGELHKNGTIDDHQVAKYRKKIESCMVTFLKIGAYTPDFEAKSHLNPRLAMSPEQRLITDMHSSSERPSDTKKKDYLKTPNSLRESEEDSHVGELTPAEIKLIRTRRRKNTTSD